MKKFYKENRVFVILMGIALFCLIIIAGMAVSYIINSSTRDLYGNRLDGIEDIKIDNKKIKEMKKEVSSNEKVSSVEINIHGKIIYFDIDFSDDTTLEEAKNVAIKCLEFFETDYRNFYDIQFMFTKKTCTDSEDKFPILGYIKSGNTVITWSHNGI